MPLFKRKQKQVLTEKEVLKQLDIPNFKKMTTEKVTTFTSLIPEMPPEVLKTALQQFPHFAQTASQVMICYKEMISTALSDNSESTKDFYASCDTVINALNELLNAPKLRFKQKKFIVENMTQILKMKKSKDSENKEWLKDCIKVVSTAAVAIVGVVGAVLGINLLKR